VKIAVDAMGGDHAPREIVKGSCEAALALPEVEIILVGDQKEIEKVEGFEKPANVTIKHTSGVISFNDDPVSRSAQNSIGVCCNLVKTREADAFISAGNTGACMASAVILWKKIAKIERPAIPIPIPTPTGAVVLIDAGANVDCKPLNLHQFAIMGAIYSERVLGVRNPRIGILSNGTEDKKGNKLSLEAFALLKESKLNFIGNVEGSGIFKNTCDVLVCDGFVGNGVLKAVEATSEMILTLAYDHLSKTEGSSPGQDSIKGFILDLKKRLDYAEYGGAPLLGVNGTCIISHGSSKAKAIKNAVFTANKFVNEKINEKIELDTANLF